MTTVPVVSILDMQTLKQWAQKPDEFPQAQEDVLEQCMDAAQSTIENLTSREYGKQLFTETFDGNEAHGRNGNELWVRNTPIVASPEPVVTENGSTLTVTTGYDATGAIDVVYVPKTGRFVRRQLPSTSQTIGDVPYVIKWSPGFQNITIAYTSGYGIDAAPEDLMQLMREFVWLMFHEARRIGVGSVSRGGNQSALLKELTPMSKLTLKRYTVHGRPL